MKEATPVLKEFSADVVICGGGTAGLPAALAAAREGKSVIIVEKGVTIGGAPVNNLINCHCGRPFHGICLEHILKMKELSQDYMYDYRDGCQYKNTFKTGDYLIAWKQLLRGLPVKVFTEQNVNYAETGNDGSIAYISSGTAKFKGKVYIDASGDADLAIRTDCKVTMGREARSQYNEPFAPEKADGKVQRCTLMYTVKRKRENVYGEKPNWAEYNESEYLIWGPAVAVANPTDELEISEATQKAYEMILEQNESWREKGLVITAVAPRIGVRETRRIIGSHVLTAREMMDQKRFADSITVVTQANIDPWDPDGNPLHDKDKSEDCKLRPFEIPYSCLITGAVPNMIVAGRCISATHVANSALRVMPICMATGQAAGIAASLASEMSAVNAAKIDINRMQKKLAAGGVQVSL